MATVGINGEIPAPQPGCLGILQRSGRLDRQGQRLFDQSTPRMSSEVFVEQRPRFGWIMLVAKSLDRGRDQCRIFAGIGSSTRCNLVLDGNRWRGVFGYVCRGTRCSLVLDRGG